MSIGVVDPLARRAPCGKPFDICLREICRCGERDCMTVEHIRVMGEGFADHDEDIRIVRVPVGFCLEPVSLAMGMQAREGKQALILGD